MTLRFVVTVAAIAAIASIALFVRGCRPSEREYATLDAWLLCDDCQDGEREAVRAIGDKLVHTLDQALRSPTRGRIANKEAQFHQMYRTLQPPPTLLEPAYVAELLSNYIARYQQRAALSLGDIGGSRAIAALRKARDSAVVRAYRPDVVAVIESVLALKESDTFAGTVTPRTPRFADTVRVGQGTGLAWNGDESVRLLGSPFADSLVIDRATDSLAFVAAALPGYTALVIRGLGPNNNVTQAAPLQIIPPAYRAHPPATAPELTGLPFPQTRYLALPSAPKSDSGDHFRFQPGVNRRITASLTGADVRGGTVSWLECSTLGGLRVVAPATLAGRVIGENGAPVVGADVRIVGLAIRTTTGVGGRFVLNNLSASSPILVRVQMIGYQASDNLVQLGVDSVTLLMRSPGSKALGTFASSVTVPAGGCHYLRITSSPPTRIIRLRLTSP